VLGSLACCGLLAAPAALGEPGALDSAFGSGGVATVAAGTSSAGAGTIVQPGGDVIVEGQEDASLLGPIYITATRLLPSGAPDPCFGSTSCTGNGTVDVSKGQTYSGAALAQESNGQLLVAGAIRATASGAFGLGVVRLVGK
jgi:hypothetical protein